MVNALPLTKHDLQVQSKTIWDKVFCALGLIGAFVLYGVIQERIMTIPYGEQQEMFKNTTYIVFSNRVIAVLGAACLLWWNGSSLRPSAPLSKFALIATLNTASTYCQWESLKYVSFPTQTLGKCGKTIPVLILGSIFIGKKYGIKDYITCFMIAIGCTTFILTGDIQAHTEHEEKEDTILGIGLICAYLLLDGSTSVLQEKLFRAHKDMPVHNQMLFVNIFSGSYMLLVLLSSGGLVSAFQFCVKYPSFLVGSTGISFAAMLGQMMLYYTIKHFDALFYASIMTTRQVFSITLSCLIYFHPLSVFQIFSAATVFGAVYLKSFLKNK